MSDDKKNEPSESSGIPSPEGEKSVIFDTVTDLDLKSLQSDYLKAEADSDANMPKQFCVIVQKSGQKIPLKTNKVKIGRDPTNQVVVAEDTFASRHHAWITFEDGDFWIEDLGSTNGTLLNGHPVVKRQILSTGDKVRVGHTELTFEVE